MRMVATMLATPCRLSTLCDGDILPVRGFSQFDERNAAGEKPCKRGHFLIP
jgi:hypothetical protein